MPVYAFGWLAGLVESAVDGGWAAVAAAFGGTAVARIVASEGLDAWAGRGIAFASVADFAEWFFGGVCD